MNPRIVLACAILAVAAIAWWIWMPKPSAPELPTTPLTAFPRASESAVPPSSTPETKTSAAVATPEPKPMAKSSPNPVASTDYAVTPPAKETSPVEPNPEVKMEFEKIQRMLRDYRTAEGENPVGTNAEIMKSLMGGNRRQATFGPPEGMDVNANGELVDQWGTPFFFHQISGTHMELRSAGPDKKMYTSDDIIQP